MEIVLLPEKLKYSLRKKILKKIKINSLIALVLATIGIIFAILASEEYYKEDLEQKKERNEENAQATILRFVVSVSTTFLIFFIFNHYRLLLQFLKCKEFIDGNKNIFTSGYWKWLAFESTICLIHSPPFVNYSWTAAQQQEDLTYSLDMIFTLVCLLRIYHLIRVFLLYSNYYNKENTDRVLNDCRILGGTEFVLKCELKERPFTILTICILIVSFFFGYALRAAELPYIHVSNQDWTYIWNGMWCILITMTTVGYGDFYPMTYLGRSIGVTACYLGTFLISLAIVSLTISLEFEPTQARAYKNAIRYHQKSLNRKYAATLIQACYKYRFYMSKNHDVSLRTKAEKTYFIKKAIKNFKDQRLRIREMEFTLRTDEMYQQINDKINSDFDKLVIDSKVITVG
ncbi:unnamed protein product [Moneuplotes crassus]|uniref:Potassium channel domain-containing protein n=1 Tax=Euplotes crassus TaxID=5936 RepID=A0AAD1UCU7_EUPCR|nr:unnamed protein product [Moneuplotes crassus]